VHFRGPYARGLDATLDVIGNEGAVLRLRARAQCPQRFGELRRELPKIGEKALTQQRREPESGCVRATQPPRARRGTRRPQARPCHSDAPEPPPGPSGTPRTSGAAPPHGTSASSWRLRLVLRAGGVQHPLEAMLRGVAPLQEIPQQLPQIATRALPPARFGQPIPPQHLLRPRHPLLSPSHRHAAPPHESLLPPRTNQARFRPRSTAAWFQCKRIGTLSSNPNSSALVRRPQKTPRPRTAVATCTFIPHGTRPSGSAIAADSASKRARRSAVTAGSSGPRS